VSLDNITHDLDIDTEVLVHEDVPKPADLGPGNVGMGISDLGRQMIRCFPDDLEIALNRILGHLDQAVIMIECAQIPLALLDRVEDIRDALLWVATHNLTASASA